MLIKDFDQLARWINGISYNAAERRWVARIFGGKTIEALTFPKLADRIGQAVGIDILGNVCDALDVDFDCAYDGIQARAFVDARYITAYILVKDLKITCAATSLALGFGSHSSVITAIRNVKTVRDVAAKLQKVYTAYSWIKKNEIEL